MKTIWNLYIKYFDIISIILCFMTFFIFKRMQLYKEDLNFVDIIAGFYWLICFYWTSPPKMKYYEYLVLPAFAYTIGFYVIHWDRMSEMFQKMWEIGLFPK